MNSKIFKLKIGRADALAALFYFGCSLAAMGASPEIVSGIPDIDMNENSVAADVPFTINYTNSNANGFSFTRISPNTTLFPSGSITFGGTKKTRTVTVTPATDRNGTETIDYRVADSDGNAVTGNFEVVVNNIPQITGIANTIGMDEDIPETITFSVGGDETAAKDLDVTITSSDTTLFPAGSLVINANNTAFTATSSLHLFGSATMQMVVSDGKASSTKTFTINVRSVNDVPVISSVNVPADMDEDVPETISFVVSDVETSRSALTITFNSANTTLFPAGSLVVNSAKTSFRATPAANEFGSSSIQMIVSDGDASATNTFTLTVLPVNDDPVITGNPDRTFPDNSTINPYSNITIGDVENDQLILSVVNQIPDSLGGNFIGSDGTGSWAATGTPAQVTSQIQNLVFQPGENKTAPGGTHVERFDVSVRERFINGAVTVSEVSALTIQSVNDDPVILDFSVSPSLIDDTQSVSPFVLIFSDPDFDESFTVTLTAIPSNLGTLSATSLTGTASEIESQIRSVEFAPYSDIRTDDAAVEFEISISDGYGATVINSTPRPFITIRYKNEPPSIRGVELDLIRINDDETIAPFPGVTILDPDEGGNSLLEVHLSVVNSSLGHFSSSSITGTPSEVTTWIQTVLFVPEANVVAVGDAVSSQLKISVTDGSNDINSSETEVVVTGVNGAPVIKGIPAVQPMKVELADARPFKDLTIEDDGTGNVILQIEIDLAEKGVLSNAVTGVTGLVFETNSIAVLNGLLTNLVYYVAPDYKDVPPEFPGDTTFTLTVTDELGNRNKQTLRIFLQQFSNNILVTRTEDDLEPGSLRYALGLAVNNDVITFAINQEEPAMIRLNPALGVIVINRQLSFKGPGADKLIISGDRDGNFVPDTQLFRINSSVTMEGIALEYGVGDYGGAVSVGPTGSLYLRYCSVSESVASLWGGAIDVDGGSLMMENCLLKNNRTDAASGLGGGAVSLYTDQYCRFENTTFSGNRQDSITGYGGGALYAETVTSAYYLDADVLHCTFAENEDVTAAGSSVFANGFGSSVIVQNSIFADGSGFNLGVAGVGEIVSWGGNISDDSTYTVFMQSGSPQSIYLLDDDSDRTSLDPELMALTRREGSLIRPLEFYPLDAGGPAVDGTNNAFVAIDQRGILRTDSNPDCGAYEYGASERLVINELQWKNNDFIEIYVPRDVTDGLDIKDYQLVVDDVLIHTFASKWIKPGSGIIVAENNSVQAGGPPPTTVIVVPSLDLGQRGTISLRTPAAHACLAISYNGAFASISNEFDSVLYQDSSLTLSPQFSGFAYLPHALIGTGDNSPGFDTTPMAFGSPNASVVAFDDRVILREDDVSRIDVLGNDVDADRTDTIVVTGLPLSQTGITTNLADYWVSTNTGSYGDGILYSPLDSTNIQELAEGDELTEVIRYAIADMGTGTVVSVLNAGGSNVLQTVEEHRFVASDVVELSEAGGADGLYAVLDVLSPNSVTLDGVFASSITGGVWTVLRTSDEADVHLTILGENDAPDAVADTVFCQEEMVLRLFALTPLLSTNVSFPSDAAYPVPVTRFPTHLLSNDTDIDLDDDADSLTLVGIVGGSSAMGAEIVLELRADRTESSLVYNPLEAPRLDALATNEVAYDTFSYVIADQHGALSTGVVTVVVSGENDFPVAYTDPDIIGALSTYIQEGEELADVLDNLIVLDSTSARSGQPDRVDARIVVTNKFTEADSVVLSSVWSTYESQPLSIAASQIHANDTDVDESDELSVVEVFTSREDASVTIEGSNVLYSAESESIHALARGEQLLDIFYAVITDGFGGYATNLTAVIVTGVNDQPIPVADNFATAEDQIIIFATNTHPVVNDFDRDVNGRLPDNQLRVIDSSGLSEYGGRFSISNTAGYYDPADSVDLDGMSALHSVTDSFEYAVTDQSFIFANDDLFLVAVDSVSIELPVMANDRNYTEYQSSMIISHVGLPNHGGVLEFNTNSTALIYTPAVNYVGDETFTYSIRDAWGSTDNGRVTVRVSEEALNGKLQANNDLFSAAKGETVQLDVLANDNRLPDQAASLTIVNVNTNGLDGTVQWNQDMISYSNSNSTVTESFTYEISGGGTATASAVVTVKGVDRDRILPVSDDAFSVLANSINNSLTVLLNDAILPDAADVFIQAFSALPLNGEVSIDTVLNTVIYSPQPGFVGIDKFEYILSDGLGGSGYGVVTVSVGTLTTQEDVFVLSPGSGSFRLDVLANDRLLPETGGSITIRAVGALTEDLGSLVNRGGYIEFTPYTNSSGSTSFTYEIEDDSSGVSRTAQSRVTLRLVDPGAYANTDRIAVLANSQGVILDVLNNDASVEFDRPLVITQIGTGIDAPDQGGSVVISPDGKQLTYSPAAGFAGEETFTYSMSDSLGSDSAKVVIQVQSPSIAVNDDAFVVFFEGEDTSTFSLPVLLNDTLLPSGSGLLTIEGLGLQGPSHNGTVEVAEDGQMISYTPDTNYAGSFPYTETFMYEVSDGLSGRMTSTVSVQVLLREGTLTSEINDDVFSVHPDSFENKLTILLNDGVLPGNSGALAISSVSACAYGGNAVARGTLLLYTPKPGFLGTDSFSYSVSDGLGGTAEAEVLVNVGAVILNEDSFAVISGSVSNEMAVLANDYVLPNTNFALVIHGAGSSMYTGTVTAVSNRVFYTPSASYGGSYPYTDQFIYTVRDDSLMAVTQQVQVLVVEAGSDRDTTTVSIVVQGVNDVPVISGISGSLTTDDKTPIQSFANTVVSDVDEWGAELQQVTITIDDPEKGELISLGGFSDIGAGVYQMTATPADITASLTNLFYVPVENRIPVGTNETVTLSLSVQDPFAPLPTTELVDILVTPVNDVPLISGTRSGQAVYHELSIQALSSVTITEIDDRMLQTLDIQVALDEPSHGILSSLGVFSDLGGGVYSATGMTAAEASDALRKLVFEPSESILTSTNGSETTVFTLSVNDGYSDPSLDMDTSVIAYLSLIKSVDSISQDSANSGRFGMTVGATRDWIAVASPASNADGRSGGAVTLYSRDLGGAEAWGELKTLLSPDASGGDEFGLSVAMDEDTLVIGAPKHSGSGAVYVFRQNEGGEDVWGLVSKLVATNGAAGDRFGASVSIDGDTVAVGAYHASVNNADSGGVYLFSRDQGGTDQWGQVQVVGPDAGPTGSLFGYAVSLHNNRLVAGAPLDNMIGPNAGAAYAFELDTQNSVWVSVQKIFGDLNGENDQFGFSVDIHDDTLAVGAPLDSLGNSGSGAVFAFSYRESVVSSPWRLDRRLARPMAASGELFGTAVSLDRGVLAVGAPGVDAELSANVGEVSVYGRDIDGTNSWGLIELIASPDGISEGTFGTALAIDRYTLAVCSPGNPKKNIYPGKLNIFRLKFNNAPVSGTPIADQITTVNDWFEFAVPDAAFVDPDQFEEFTWTAQLANGDSLSTSWLSLDAATGVFSGTSAVTGQLSIVVIATDLDEQSATNTFNITVVPINGGALLTGKNQWKVDYFGSAVLASPNGPAQDWSDDADSDADGLSNLAEYVFGSDPVVHSDGEGHTLDIVDASVPSQLTAEYNRRSDDPTLVYTIMKSNDLVVWQDGSDLLISESAVPLGGGMERVTVVLERSDSQCFFRVQVSE